MLLHLPAAAAAFGTIAAAALGAAALAATDCRTASAAAARQHLKGRR